MTSQQAIFADTIACMKKAIKRKSYDSDSDSSIDRCTNRGHKLRKKARYVHEGQLARPSGPQVYRKTVEHAGYQRDILCQNPPLVDEDGYEVDTEDDEERTQAAMATAAQFNPYAQVKLEHILGPLTSASGLPDHPTLLKPFVSPSLTQLTQQARDMMQKEKSKLWKLKRLMTRMSGDNTWIPCESVEGKDDWALFFDEPQHGPDSLPRNKITTEETVKASVGRTLIGVEQHSPDSIIAAVKQLIAKKQQNGNVTSHGQNFTDTFNNKEGSSTAGNQTSFHSQEAQNKSFASTDGKRKSGPQTSSSYNSGRKNIEDQEPVPTQRRMRMRTRAQAHADSENATSRTRSLTPEPENESVVHPYFLAARSSLPDRNFGLPKNEAAETRRILQLYVQKQEEVCRGVQRIYDGLLKADRCRKLIVKWTKADGHVGVNRDMSDGEDWYDNDEWNLDEDLKKGQEEEEEDAATTAKKTRARRQ